MQSFMKAQKLKAPRMKSTESTFHKNLEEALDVRRADHGFYAQIMPPWRSGTCADFSSNDLLSLGATGLMRKAFLDELARHPDFNLYAGGSRLTGGNYPYIEMVEKEIAEFHGVEEALVVASGFEANIAIFSSIPRPGDAIVYDELVHASTHDGMSQSHALCRKPFRHNDVDSFRDTIADIMGSQPMIANGSRSIIFAVEAVYSMDGDVCPIEEMIEIAREEMPESNFAFILDEAHATGIIGPKGGGLAQSLGIEKDIAVRLHTYGKAMASTGAVILGNSRVRAMVQNFARSLIFTTAPSFPAIASVRAAYNLMKDGTQQKMLDNIQENVKYFFKQLTLDPVWPEAVEMGTLSIPLAEGWEQREHFVHMVPVWSRQRYTYWLSFHLNLSGISAYPIDYPTVPKGQSRVRLVFHGTKTKAEVDRLVRSICAFASEMIEIEKGQTAEKAPKAAQYVYSLLAANAS
ncbi:5-aminolevulinate synthase [Astrocystis sublimbata]|nr:5-aminolevulinate synthase [Astrocystis sublimbata]